MSPAEITQQLGLQSLTRRAWVSNIVLIVAMFLFLTSAAPFSSSNPPALPRVMVCMRDWNGSQTP